MNRKPDHLAATTEEEGDFGLLSALGSLGEGGALRAEELFDSGLRLLVDKLKVDRALVVRRTSLGLENLWWAHPEEAPQSTVLTDPAQGYCPRVLEVPSRTLVIRDARADASWCDHPAWRRHGVAAYVGAPLRHGDGAVGVLSVQHGEPRAWARAEISMVATMASLFSKTLEVEALKEELRRTQEALDLSSAVVEDSALENPLTGLPNRRYLDIWVKSNLYVSRRRGAVMTVATWEFNLEPGLRDRMARVADALRGEDLLVDLGHHRLLLLLPRTGRAASEALLKRIRNLTGPVPMGATVWNPLFGPDRNDRMLAGAMQRAWEALGRSRAGGVDGPSGPHWVMVDSPHGPLFEDKGNW